MAIQQSVAKYKVEEMEMTKQQAIKLAKKYAKDIAIRDAGVTKDYCVVTTIECVNYQKSINNLLYHFKYKP